MDYLLNFNWSPIKAPTHKYRVDNATKVILLPLHVPPLGIPLKFMGIGGKITLEISNIEQNLDEHYNEVAHLRSLKH